MTLLFQACRDNNIDVVRKLVDSDIECKHSNGWTPLMIACQNGHIKIVRLLLFTGRAHPESYTYAETSALMKACERGHVKVVKLLLATGMSHPEKQCICGWTALMIACFYGHIKIVKLLLAHGQAHPEYQNIEGNTAYSYINNKLLLAAERHQSQKQFIKYEYQKLIYFFFNMF